MSQHVTFDSMPAVFEYDRYRRSRKTAVNCRRREEEEEEDDDDDEKPSVSSVTTQKSEKHSRNSSSRKHNSRPVRRSAQRTSSDIADLRSDNGDAQSVGETGFKRNALTIDEVEMGGIVDAIRSTKARLEEKKEQVVVQLIDQWEQERQRILKKWKNQEELLRLKHQQSFSRNTITVGFA